MAVGNLLCSVALVLGLSATVYGYSSGAPPTEYLCQTLQPKHQARPQDSQPPFSFTTSSTSVRAGQSVTFKLSAPAGSTFQGFLIAARKSGTDAQDLHGSFNVPNSSSDQKAAACDHDSVKGILLTHTSKSDKSSVTATWQAPSEKGQYDILVTYLQSYPTFWRPERAATITVQ